MYTERKETLVEIDSLYYLRYKFIANFILFFSFIFYKVFQFIFYMEATINLRWIRINKVTARF